MQKIIIASLCILFSLMACASPEHVQLDRVDVNVKGIVLSVEYADTQALRNKGLMHRKSLCKDCGMLFKFETSRMASMWMKNTFIPLDVAFITENGVITDIKAMTPHDLSPVGSSEKVKFALEMNQGWFKENGVAEGDKVILPEK